jgi:hypothetical protein
MAARLASPTIGIAEDQKRLGGSTADEVFFALSSPMPNMGVDDCPGCGLTTASGRFISGVGFRS